MTKKELQKVQDCVENEGFDYAFLAYSDFEEIKDKDFHELRIAFIEAAEKLKAYLEIED